MFENRCVKFLGVRSLKIPSPVVNNIVDIVTDCVIDETLNTVKDGFSVGMNDKVLNDLLNPLKPLKIDKNLSSLINDDLAP